MKSFLYIPGKLVIAGTDKPVTTMSLVYREPITIFFSYLSRCS